MRAPALLARRGVVRRPAAGGGGEAVVEFTAPGCAGCGLGRRAAADTLRIATALPPGTVVDVQVRPRRLLAQAARVFAPPLVAVAAASAVFADAPHGGALAVAGLLLGVLAAIAGGWASRRRARTAAEWQAITLRPVGATADPPPARLRLARSAANGPGD